MTARNNLLLAIAIYFSGCLSTDTKCCEPGNTSLISKGLYLERYKVFCAGVFGEVTGCYLTDSLSFRQKIGSYDEHETFIAKIKGNQVVAYNFQSRLISDTIEKKTITQISLWKFDHSEENCRKTIPIFGINTIMECIESSPASSYKTDDGMFMTEIQYKCGSDYSNAVFYTDSLNFSVFLGVYNPGSFENKYSVQRIDKDRFDFYNITNRPTLDTLKVENFDLSDFKKGRLLKVCK